MTLSRQAHKARYQAYLAYAKTRETDTLKIPATATVQMVEDGAFVEAVIWVPLAALPVEVSRDE